MMVPPWVSFTQTIRTNSWSMTPARAAGAGLDRSGQQSWPHGHLVNGPPPASIGINSPWFPAAQKICRAAW
jgi:hypothetical protein